VGAGVGLAIAVTSNSAEARVEPEVVLSTCFAPEAVLSTCSVLEVCGPVAAVGTLKEARKAPLPFVITVGMPAVAPSQVTWIWLLGAKPRPATATFVPGTPLVGESVRVGPEASVPAKGTAYSPSEPTMMSVATQAPARMARP
jgi:hypothetical protein